MFHVLRWVSKLQRLRRWSSLCCCMKCNVSPLMCPSIYKLPHICFWCFLNSSLLFSNHTAFFGIWRVSKQPGSKALLFAEILTPCPLDQARNVISNFPQNVYSFILCLVSVTLFQQMTELDSPIKTLVFAFNHFFRGFSFFSSLTCNDK